MACKDCDCNCGCEHEKIRKTKENIKNAKYITMNQATYEAITGNLLQIEGLYVRISEIMPDRQYIISE